MLYKIPLQQTPNQTLSFQIDRQDIHLSLVTRNNGKLYATIKVGNKLIVANRLCLNLVPLIGVDYLPIKGNLAFIDKEGNDDPVYTGLNARFIFIYSEK